MTKSPRSISLAAQSTIAAVGLLLAACGARFESDEEVVKLVGGDYIAAAASLVLADHVAGDAILAGGEVRVSGSTVGDLLAGAGKLVLSGPVGGSVRAAGGRIDIEERIARNATIIGGEIQLGKGSAVEGNAYLSGGRITAEGTVVGSMYVGGGDVVLDGPVGGDVRIEAERLSIGPSARVEGSLTYRVPQANVRIDSAARITGATTSLPPRPQSHFPKVLRGLFLLAFLAAGSIALAVFPRTASAAVSRLKERIASSLGSGILLLLCVPIAILALLVTVIGIPVAIITATLFGVLLYLSGAIAAVWLGSRLMRQNAEARRTQLVLQFVVGAVVMAALSLIPVIGVTVRILAAVAGLGALVLAIREKPAQQPAG